MNSVAEVFWMLLLLMIAMIVIVFCVNGREDRRIAGLCETNHFFVVYGKTYVCGLEKRL